MDSVGQHEYVVGDSKSWNGSPVEHSHEIGRKREAVFKSLRQRAAQSIALIELTSPSLSERGHRSWAWDASAMPAGGHYFPAYVEILEELERTEGVNPDTHILCETTTGTAGIALGFVASRLGYRVVLFMPEDMPKARIKAVRENLPDGSELFLTPAGQYVQGAVHEFRRFIARHRTGYKGYKLCLVDHSRRPEAVTAIRSVILQALSRLPQRARINAAVAALGNGTSSSALFQAVRHVYPEASTIGVEPIESPTGFIQKYGAEELLKRFGVRHSPKPHFLLGSGGWGIKLPHLDVSVIDEIWPLAFESWRSEQRALAAMGLDVGNTSAASQTVIEALSAKSPNEPKGYMSIVYDRPSLY